MMKPYGSPRLSPEARITERARAERRGRRDRRQAHEARHAARARAARDRKAKRQEAHQERLERIKARDDSEHYRIEALLLRETKNAYQAEDGGKSFWISKRHLGHVTITPAGEKQRLRGTAPFWVVQGWPKAARTGEVLG